VIQDPALESSAQCREDHDVAGAFHKASDQPSAMEKPWIIRLLVAAAVVIFATAFVRQSIPPHSRPNPN